MHEYKIYSIRDMVRYAEKRLHDVKREPDLSPLDRCYIKFAVATSCANLNKKLIDESLDEARALGANRDAMVEILLLVSSLGSHTLMLGLSKVNDIFEYNSANEVGYQSLPTRFQGSKYWKRFGDYFPNFLTDLYQLDNKIFNLFVEWCGLAWRGTYLTQLQKELLSIAIDCTSSHRYGPGFRFHLENAIECGASTDQILTVINEASLAEKHIGIFNGYVRIH